LEEYENDERPPTFEFLPIPIPGLGQIPNAQRQEQYDTVGNASDE
jgi:hypothetical protein